MSGRGGEAFEIDTNDFKGGSGRPGSRLSASNSSRNTTPVRGSAPGPSESRFSR
jgi:hypothetical protein